MTFFAIGFFAISEDMGARVSKDMQISMCASALLTLSPREISASPNLSQ